MYVTNLQSNNISAYVIDAQSGALTPVAGSPFPADFPHSVAVDPQGKYAYVVTNKSISAYMIDSVSGALAAIAGSPQRVRDRRGDGRTHARRRQPDSHGGSNIECGD
ncbi:MAG TPA: beta-propeller fold lactonase family protein [Steroidobacteraceae bacterium]